MFLFRFLLSFMSALHSRSQVNTVLHAFSPGDIIIGGLLPIHTAVNNMTTKQKGFTCTDYDFQLFLRSQVMIYAIEQINQHTPRRLPNLTLGYEIYDTCADVSLTIRETLQLMSKQSDPNSCPIPANISSVLPEPQTKVVIGERYSEISTAVARILALTSVPQISFASTSEVLSEKSKFPTFFRTVPSDTVQTKAIYQLVKEFNWKTVAIIGSNDEYGKYGSDRLQDIFKKNKVCVEFVEILSADFPGSNSYSNNPLMDLIGTIRNSTAEAIIMFTKDTNVEPILKQAIANHLNRTWIASDTWSTSSKISKMSGIEKIGQVFGFIYKRNEVPGFRDHVRSMFNGSQNDILKYHLSHYPLCSNGSEGKIQGNASMNCSDPETLASFVDQDESYSLYLAVQVAAEGLRRSLGCNDQRCERTNITASELLEEIAKVNITVNTTNLNFTNGDPNLGYDIVFWNSSASNQGMEIQSVGEYWPNESIILPKFPKDLQQNMKSMNVTVFSCYKICEPGKMLSKKSGSCCFECVECKERETSNGTVCTACDNSEYANDRKDKCLKKTLDYLLWTDPISITLSCFAVLAILIVLVFFVVFRMNAGTPIVKAVGGCLCFLELLSLLFSFSLVFTFLGKPTKATCAGIPLFGVGFSLCMSCILSNLFQILLGFQFNMNVSTWIKKLNQPVVLVLTIGGIQLALSVSWLITNPPKPLEDHKTETILYQCEMDKASERFFIATVTYNAFLGLICFLFAFKGRQLPDLYRNAALITISMVLFLIIWIIFLPLFLTLEGRYRPATYCAAILISSYSILSCHLAPKCYIMVFRKELNNEKAISEYIRKYYEMKGMAMIK